MRKGSKMVEYQDLTDEEIDQFIDDMCCTLVTKPPIMVVINGYPVHTESLLY